MRGAAVLGAALGLLWLATTASRAQEAAPPKPDPEVSRITLHVKDAKLTDVLKEFAKQSGNRLVYPPDDWDGRAVSLDVKDLPYWEAMEELCRKTSCLYEPVPKFGERSGLTLTRVAKMLEPAGYTGPAVFRVVQATGYRDFRPLPDEPRTTVQLEYQLVYYWEDRLPVLGTRVRWKQATTPEGGGMPLGYDDPLLPIRRYYRDGTTCPQGYAELAFWPRAEAVKHPGTVEGTLTVALARGAKKEIVVEDVLGEGEKSATEGNITLTTTKVANDQEKGFTVTLLTKPLIDGQPAGERLPIMHSTGEYGVFLVDPHGERHRPQLLQQKLIENENGLLREPWDRFHLTFTNLPRLEGKWSAVCVYPEEMVVRTYEIELTNLPIP